MLLSTRLNQHPLPIAPASLQLQFVPFTHYSSPHQFTIHFPHSLLLFFSLFFFFRGTGWSSKLHVHMSILLSLGGGQKYWGDIEGSDSWTRFASGFASFCCFGLEMWVSAIKMVCGFKTFDFFGAFVLMKFEAFRTLWACGKPFGCRESCGEVDDRFQRIIY